MHLVVQFNIVRASASVSPEGRMLDVQESCTWRSAYGVNVNTITLSQYHKCTGISTFVAILMWVNSVRRK